MSAFNWMRFPAMFTHVFDLMWSQDLGTDGISPKQKKHQVLKRQNHVSLLESCWVVVAYSGQIRALLKTCSLYCVVL